MKAEYLVVHFSFLWGVTCLRLGVSTAERNVGLHSNSSCAESFTWAQPLGLQLSCWWMKLHAETFLFAVSAAALQQHFASLSFMASFLDDFGPNEILVNSPSSVLSSGYSHKILQRSKPQTDPSENSSKPLTGKAQHFCAAPFSSKYEKLD